mgnify:CR=1 FL=1
MNRILIHLKHEVKSRLVKMKSLIYINCALLTSWRSVIRRKSKLRLRTSTHWVNLYAVYGLYRFLSGFSEGNNQSNYPLSFSACLTNFTRRLKHTSLNGFHYVLNQGNYKLGGEMILANSTGLSYSRIYMNYFKTEKKNKIEVWKNLVNIFFASWYNYT